MMDASPAPMMIRHTSSVQKLLAKPQPTEDIMKMAIPQPASPSEAFQLSLLLTVLWCIVESCRTVGSTTCKMQLGAAWHVRKIASVRALTKLTNQSESIVVLAQL